MSLVAESVEFFGEQFEVADRIGLMPLMRFAKLAKSGADSADMEALVVMYDLIEQTVAPSDWPRFQDCADRNRADSDDLMGLVTKAIELISQRPTSRPSDSSDGPPATKLSSTVVSSLPVKQRLEAQGRPDLALMVLTAQEQRSA